MTGILKNTLKNLYETFGDFKGDQAHLNRNIRNFENLENIISGLLDEIVSISNNYNIDIHNGDSNYNYYRNEFKNILNKEIIE